MPRRLRSLICCAALLAGALLPCACGDSEPSSGTPDAGKTAAAPRAPDEPGAIELLTRLRERVVRGEESREFGADVAGLGQLLWTDATDAAAQAMRTHALLANVARSVGHEQVLPAEVRAQRAEVDAISREIHGQWLAAAARPPGEYRDWVATTGADLVTRLQADRAKLHERPGR